MATETVSQSAQEARAAAVEKRQKDLDANENAKRTGKGPRLQAGLTRGKNPQLIVFEQFDTNKAEQLPSTPVEFVEVSGISDEAKLTAFLIDGYNASMRDAASDPVSEFVNPAWDDDRQKNFKIAVKNYATATGVSLEDAVALIKPGIDAAFAKAAK
jgi:hypothetical protein